MYFTIFSSIDPTFIGSSFIPSEEKIYFFFSEVGREYDFIDKFTVSRIAQVCTVRTIGSWHFWSFPHDSKLPRPPCCPFWLSFVVLILCSLVSEWYWGPADPAATLDHVCQSPALVPVWQWAALQCHPGYRHPPAAQGCPSGRHALLWHLQLSVVSNLN